jgi:hypothetical protein
VSRDDDLPDMSLDLAVELACPPGDTGNPHAGRPNFTIADYLQMCRDGEAKFSLSEVSRLLGVPRVTLHRWMFLASVPEAEILAIIDEFTAKGKRVGTTAIYDEIRRRTGRAKKFDERCPHCGGVLRTRIR